MKIIIILLALILAGLSLPVLGVEAQERTAVIVDKAGVTSEVTEISVSGDFSRFDEASGEGIVIGTKMFEIAIPIGNLISVEVKGKSAEVRYQWMGYEKTISGELGSETFKGKTDFGEFKLNSGKLKRLTFKEGPTVMKEEKPLTYDATLVLTDGTKIPVANLKRHDSYWSSKGYLIGGRTRYYHYTDFSFLKGESLLTVPFENIKTIEFGPGSKVDVTLKNGKSATGKLSDEDNAGVDGFTGLCDEGEFFINPEHVKAIEFGAAQK